jgi:hypothetical protein
MNNGKVCSLVIQDGLSIVNLDQIMTNVMTALPTFFCRQSVVFQLRGTPLILEAVDLVDRTYGYRTDREQ